MKKLLVGLATGMLFLNLAGVSSATIVTEGNFVSPTMIDFEVSSPGFIDNYYIGSGVQFVNVEGGNSYNTGHGYSLTGTNFSSGYPNGEAIFSSLITRVGMDITTNDGDDTTLFAYNGTTLVGSHSFNTFGAGLNGSFIGIEFLSGFDKLVIDTSETINGAFAIDNLRFESIASVPEPATMFLLGIGIAGLVAARRKKEA
jgi:hypothetical protein